MNFAKNLRALRKHFQQSQQELADLLDYRSFTTIQKWEDGSSVPPLEILQKLAGFYHLSVDEFIYGELNFKNNLVPVLGRVQAGIPITAIENISGYEMVSEGENSFGEYFYLEISGDSMKNLRILPGDRVYIRRQSYLEENEVGVVLVDGEATLKRVKYHGDKIILISENENYPPLEYDLKVNQVEILGKLIHNKIIY